MGLHRQREHMGWAAGTCCMGPLRSPLRHPQEGGDPEQSKDKGGEQKG